MPLANDFTEFFFFWGGGLYGWLRADQSVEPVSGHFRKSFPDSARPTRVFPGFSAHLVLLSRLGTQEKAHFNNCSKTQ